MPFGPGRAGHCKEIKGLSVYRSRTPDESGTFPGRQSPGQQMGNGFYANNAP